jgi:hypothetical protein
MIIISQHAYERSKERLSLRKSSTDRLARKAFDQGLKHTQTTGPLRKYVDGLWMQHKQASNIRIYGDNIFLFAGNILVTLYQLPLELRRIAHNLQ